MKTAKLAAKRIIYFYYAAIYYFCISITFLAKTETAKRSITALVLFLFSLIIFFTFMAKGFFRTPPHKGIIKNPKHRKIITQYNSSIVLALYSSIIFFCAILSYLFQTEKTVSLLLLLSSTVLLFLSSSVFLSESNIYNQHYKSATSWIVKIGWIAGSFYAYAQARHDFMNIADLTYDQTASRFCVILYAGLILITYVSLAVASAGVALFFFEETSTNVNKKDIIIIRDSSPLFIPLTMTAFVTLLIIISNLKPVFNTALNISIPVDATETFKCNGASMMLAGEGEKYYLLLNEGEYRVFTHKNKNWYSSRLTCLKEKPYFEISEIKNKKDIITSNFENLKKNALDNFNAIIK
ncbi:hypothetical protein ACWXVW_18060 [Pantoea dispersa]|uniref:hypothetical protein n=1 Tax=Pantoea dispersa TaxID=59814 RepID=UPI002DB7CA87|nr:hypothetical protein [Pantoea dispersa]MEB5972251.1 hypothetical protein [Pantoea dispersa]